LLSERHAVRWLSKRCYLVYHGDTQVPGSICAGFRDMLAESPKGPACVRSPPLVGGLAVVWRLYYMPPSVRFCICRCPSRGFPVQHSGIRADTRLRASVESLIPECALVAPLAPCLGGLRRVAREQGQDKDQGQDHDKDRYRLGRGRYKDKTKPRPDQARTRPDRPGQDRP